ncbi:MAG: hypothetical protein F6K03_16920, partial [Kamptonema sp. SIO4C4]|nr:hypothetical protein [Kamptonema sp. SIO4C4]
MDDKQESLETVSQRGIESTGFQEQSTALPPNHPANFSFQVQATCPQTKA